jgi:hypothetical protein
MNRRIVITMFFAAVAGCAGRDSESSSQQTTITRSKPLYTPPPEATKTPEPKVKSTVWLPPLEKYDKPVKKEKWFRPNVGGGGGVAVACGSCGGSGQRSCYLCEGTGTLKSPTGLQNRSGTWIYTTSPCIQCLGSGGRSCSTCGGRGYLKEEG